MAKLTEQDKLDKKRYLEQVEQFREAVQMEELHARMNKATHDKMYYFIEGVRIMPEYEKEIDKAEKQRAEQKKMQEDLIKAALSTESIDESKIEAIVQPAQADPEMDITENDEETK